MDSLVQRSKCKTLSDEGTTFFCMRGKINLGTENSAM